MASAAGWFRLKVFTEMGRDVYSEQRFVMGIARFLKAFGEAARATKQIKQFKRFHPVETMVSWLQWRQFHILAAVSSPSPDQIAKALIQVITEERKAQGLTYEQLADRAGVHRTTIALWERQERNPTIQLALQLANALNVSLSLLLARSEAVCQTSQSATSLAHRRLRAEHFRNEGKLRSLTGLSHQTIRSAIEDCYKRNKPKGHLPKPGLHLTFRYVLCDREGCFTKGKENRGKTAHVWEVKAGV